jgi:hypothetical protein
VLEEEVVFVALQKKVLVVQFQFLVQSHQQEVVEVDQHLVVKLLEIQEVLVEELQVHLLQQEQVTHLLLVLHKDNQEEYLQQQVVEIMVQVVVEQQHQEVQAQEV